MFQDPTNTGSNNNSNTNNAATIPPKNTLTHVFFHQHQKYASALGTKYIDDDVYSFTGSITIESDGNGTYSSLEIHPKIFNIGLHPDPNMFRDSNTTTYQVISFFPKGSSMTPPYSPPEGYVPTIITSGSLNISGILNFCVEHFNISAKNSTLSPFEKVKEINFVTPRISLWSLNIGEDPKLFSLVYDAILRNKNITHITFNKNNLEKLEKLDAPNYAKLLQLLFERQNLAFDLAENDPTPKLIIPPEITTGISAPPPAQGGSMIYSTGGNGGFGGGGGGGTISLSGTNIFLGASGGSDTIAPHPGPRSNVHRFAAGGGGAGYGNAWFGWHGNGGFGGGGGPGSDTSTINNNNGGGFYSHDHGSLLTDFRNLSLSGASSTLLATSTTNSNSNSNATTYPNVGATVLYSGSLSGTSLSGAGILQISGTFSGHLAFLDSVKKIGFTQSHVNFSSLKLGDSPKFLSLVCDTIANDKTVTSIDLSHNDLGNAPAEQLQKLINMLEKHETVTQYDISDNNFSPTLSFGNKVKRFQNTTLLQENKPSPQRGFVLT